MERKDLLKELGFSDELIDKIENPTYNVHHAQEIGSLSSLNISFKDQQASSTNDLMITQDPRTSFVKF